MSDKNNLSRIRKHYTEEARKMGASKQSTMRDENIRKLEINLLIEQIRRAMKRIPNPRILEIGCGNGYTAERITASLGISIDAMDYTPGLIEIAKARNLSMVNFRVGDVLNLNFEDNAFDIVFSERCLINLVDRSSQLEALSEVSRVLKSDGEYLMIEGFSEGLDNLNAARKVVGLEEIPPPFHNRFFKRDELQEDISDLFAITSNREEECFMSSYYFGSKVLYPSLAGELALVYNNMFVEFFTHLPPYGDYSYVKFLKLSKLG